MCTKGRVQRGEGGEKKERKKKKKPPFQTDPGYTKTTNATPLLLTTGGVGLAASSHLAAQRDDAGQQTDQNVGVEVPFVGLVKQDRRVLGEHKVELQQE